jgi:hypothetical protein
MSFSNTNSPFGSTSSVASPFGSAFVSNMTPYATMPFNNPASYATPYGGAYNYGTPYVSPGYPGYATPYGNIGAVSPYSVGSSFGGTVP